MELNDNSRKYRERLRQRDEDYEDYVRNGGCVALIFALILILTMLVAFIIFALVQI